MTDETTFTPDTDEEPERTFVRCPNDDCGVEGYWNGPVGGPCKNCGTTLKKADLTRTDQ